MARSQPKVGSIVEITFLDHCQDGPDAVECTVWGKVRAITRRAYTIQTWETKDDDDEYNRSAFNIVKSAIKNVRTLTARSK